MICPIPSRRRSGRSVGLPANVLLLLVLAGCSSIRIETDHDPSFDFTTPAAWVWGDPAAAAEADEVGEADEAGAEGTAAVDGLGAAQPLVANELVRGRVTRSVEAALAAEGLRLVEARADADLLATFRVGVEQRLNVTTTSYGSGRHGWHGSARVGVGVTWHDTQVREESIGVLVVDLRDADSGGLVWRGIARGRVYEGDDPERREARIREAVERMFERYPPQ